MLALPNFCPWRTPCVGHNNPTQDAFHEVNRLNAYKKATSKIFVSLGTGIPPHIDYTTSYFRNLIKMPIDAALESERTHKHMENLEKEPLLSPMYKYYRLNPENMGEISLDRASEYNNIVEITELYLDRKEVKEKMYEIEQVLSDQVLHQF